LCNLMQTELVGLALAPVAGPPVVFMEPKRIDKRLIQNVMMSLRSPETGLFTYASFLYFMEQEYFRAYRSANPMSVALFQMRVQAPGADSPRDPLPMSALSAAVRRISSMKRHVDLLAHYENFDYALLLPSTKSAGAVVLASRLVNALMSEDLIPGMITPQNFRISFGIACIPEDFRDLSLVLAAAEIANNVAASGPEPIVLFNQIQHKYALPGGTPTQ
jgi:GGDEF domain-containing protein